MRGEQTSLIFQNLNIFGSSPHAWGTVVHNCSRGFLRRFIPTCVGNRDNAIAVQFLPAVHPHMRGEQAKEYVRTGIFPVHPHMRGEQGRIVRGPRVSGGSSPHAWGTAIPNPLVSFLPRFIPTCVGNRDVFRIADWYGAVHPHMRGEQITFVCLSICYLRFIPTCVGNSLEAMRNAPRNAVHPHMRGEQKLPWLSTRLPTGSSPHAWGTGCRVARDRGRRRFIPTCVGNRL